MHIWLRAGPSTRNFSYEVALAVVERFVAEDPENRVWQKDLAMLRQKIGELQSLHGP